MAGPRDRKAECGQGELIEEFQRGAGVEEIAGPPALVIDVIPMIEGFLTGLAVEAGGRRPGATAGERSPNG